MKTIVIAAGYATRLYPLTENFPKPLLPIGGSTILGRLMDDIDGIDDIDGHVVVTNRKYVEQFETWAAGLRTRHPVRVVDDGTVTNEGRLGAVRDLLLAVTGSPDGWSTDDGGTLTTDDDLLVVAADNVLDFSLGGFVDAFRRCGTSMIMCHEEPSTERLRRTGVITVDADWRVTSMEEKPAEPRSHWAVPPFYIYARCDLPLLASCLHHGCGYDAPGNLARYLSTRTTLHAWPMTGHRYDIGSLDTLREAQRLFGS